MERPPILYSFRRCPYAMRARLGLYLSDIQHEAREILLRDKPQAFLKISIDGTVPVLDLGDRQIQESLDIMLWAFEVNDPENMLSRYDAALVQQMDFEFKPLLDRYKYASRFGEGAGDDARQKASAILAALDDQLCAQPYLHGNQIGASDLATLPFIRQFAHVDHEWFQSMSWSNVISWLDEFKSSKAFLAIMEKKPQWKEGDPPDIRGTITRNNSVK